MDGRKDSTWSTQLESFHPALDLVHSTNALKTVSCQMQSSSGANALPSEGFRSLFQGQPLTAGLMLAGHAVPSALCLYRAHEIGVCYPNTTLLKKKKDDDDDEGGKSKHRG